MSIVTRLLNRLRIARLDRDFLDEVQFHLDMRATHHQQAGLESENARKRAHEQFGDVEAVKRGMRRARLSSATTLATIASLVAVLMVVWVSQNRRGPGHADIPPLPAAPSLVHLHTLDGPRTSPPPPPPPPPTREECLEQAKKLPRICS